MSALTAPPVSLLDRVSVCSFCVSLTSWSDGAGHAGASQGASWVTQTLGSGGDGTRPLLLIIALPGVACHDVWFDLPAKWSRNADSRDERRGAAYAAALLGPLQG